MKHCLARRCGHECTVLHDVIARVRASQAVRIQRGIGCCDNGALFLRRGRAWHLPCRRACAVSSATERDRAAQSLVIANAHFENTRFPNKDQSLRKLRLTHIAYITADAFVVGSSDQAFNQFFAATSLLKLNIEDIEREVFAGSCLCGPERVLWRRSWANDYTLPPKATCFF